MTVTRTRPRLDAGASRTDVLLDTHWASAFESRRGRGDERSKQLRSWLAANLGRARRIAAYLGAPDVTTADRSSALPGRAGVVDVIYADRSDLNPGIRDTVIFDSWVSTNLLRPDTVLEGTGLDIAPHLVDEVFQHRTVEAYGDGRAPMFVAYPSVLKQEHRALMQHLHAGWAMTLSPYGNHLRNAGLRLTFSREWEGSHYVELLEAGRYTVYSDALGIDVSDRTITSSGMTVAVVDAPALFASVLDGLLEDSSWAYVRSDEGEDRRRPSLHIAFTRAVDADAFLARYGSAEAVR